MRFALIAVLVVGCSLIVAAGHAQQPPSFEVASIKPLNQRPAGATGFGSVTQDPSLISITSVTLRSLLRRAYGLQPFQISGPNWLDTQFYDVNAKLPSGAAEAQVPTMLQQLLAERFRMTLRWDSKQETGYALVIDKGGSKLTPSADQTAHEGDQPDKARAISISHTVQMQGSTSVALAAFLSNTLREPVTDSTGLKGRFDIILNIGFQDLAAALHGPSTSPASDGGDTPGAIFDAVRDLGLRLQPQRMGVKHLTVVRANRIPFDD
ncbi:MAG TPA: TIGR03435 family protein [Candidatus Acidoferrales bacterium]|nr:TIGR03435 family protein [Candidatus Acidoferrales bacterium]